MEIANELKKKIELPKGIDKIEASGPYLNFFVDRSSFLQDVIKLVLKEKDKYGGDELVFCYGDPGDVEHD